MLHYFEMATEDYAFYENQKIERKRKCVDDIVPLNFKTIYFKTHPLSKPSRKCQIFYQCLFSNVV